MRLGRMEPIHRPGVDSHVAEIERVLGLEEGADTHLLDPSDASQLAEGDYAHELASGGPGLGKLEEGRAVDGLKGEEEERGGQP